MALVIHVYWSVKPLKNYWKLLTLNIFSVSWMMSYLPVDETTTKIEAVIIEFVSSVETKTWLTQHSALIHNLAQHDSPRCYKSHEHYLIILRMVRQSQYCLSCLPSKYSLIITWSCKVQCNITKHKQNLFKKLNFTKWK